MTIARLLRALFRLLRRLGGPSRRPPGALALGRGWWLRPVPVGWAAAGLPGAGCRMLVAPGGKVWLCVPRLSAAMRVRWLEVN